MHTVQILLTLLLALSSALNVAFTAGLTARLAGVGTAQAILTGARTQGLAYRRHPRSTLLYVRPHPADLA